MKSKIIAPLLVSLFSFLAAHPALAASPTIDISQLQDSDQIQVLVFSKGKCSHESSLWAGTSVARSEAKKYDDETSRRFRFKITAGELRELSSEGKVSVDLASVCDSTGATIEIRAPGQQSTVKPQIAHGGRHDATISFKM